jgi:pSer/pThr/pTyr-binding forkhead associated (FHA) protein
MQQNDKTVFRLTKAELLLRGVSGVTFGRTFPLLGSLYMGRDKACEISIPSDGISRKHARIITRPGSILLEDLGSSNGTFVNNHPIQTAIVKEGDEIRLDKVRFRVLSLQQADELLAESDSITVKRKKPNSSSDKPASKSKKWIVSIFLIIVVVATTFYYIA